MEGKVFKVPLALILFLVVQFLMFLIPMVLLHQTVMVTLRNMQTSIMNQMTYYHEPTLETESAEPPTPAPKPTRLTLLSISRI